MRKPETPEERARNDRQAWGTLLRGLLWLLAGYLVLYMLGRVPGC